MKKSSGQTLLIILLVMAVGLTVGLAIISRSVTDINVSYKEEESARVFSAAEAGIEEALRLGLTSSHEMSFLVGGVNINTLVVPLQLGFQSEFVFPGLVEAGDAQTFWLVGHDNNEEITETGRYTGNKIYLYWGNVNQKENDPLPALEVTLFYKDGTSYRIKRGAFDPDFSRRNENHFEAAEVAAENYSVGGKLFKFRKEFELIGPPQIPYLLRLRLLYSNTPQALGVADYPGDGSQSFPSQGRCYESTATAASTGITSRVRQCQLYKAPVGIFDYVLYSEKDLVK